MAQDDTTRRGILAAGGVLAGIALAGGSANGDDGGGGTPTFDGRPRSEYTYCGTATALYEQWVAGEITTQQFQTQTDPGNGTAALTTGSCPPETSEVEFTLLSDSTQGVNYRVHVDAQPRLVTDAGDMSAEPDNDSIIERSDGTFDIRGSTGSASGDKAYGDTYRWEFGGSGHGILGFTATLSAAEYEVQVNGSPVDPGNFPDYEPPAGGGDDGGDPSNVGIRHSLYEGPLGGGVGMPSHLVHSPGDADVVASSGAELQAAIDTASPGDVVYIDGSIGGGFSLTTPGVIVAGNRGHGSDGRVSGTIHVEADGCEVHGVVNDLGGTHPAIRIDGRDPLFFNCEFYNADGPGQGSQVFEHDLNDSTGPRATWRQCEIHDIGYETYGWHHGYGGFWSDPSVIEYCDIYNMGRHVGSCGRTRYHIRDNHIHGQTNAGVAGNDHVWEFRAKPERCGEPCGNAVIEHNLNECSGPNGNRSSLARIRGTPSDEIIVRYNESPGSTAPTGGCEANGTHGGYDLQIVMQSRSPHDGFENVTVEGNRR